jgi:hypothetical protein
MDADDLDPNAVALAADGLLTLDQLRREFGPLMHEAAELVDGDYDAAAAVVAHKLLSDPAEQEHRQRLLHHAVLPLLREVLGEEGYEQDPDSTTWRKATPS